MDDACVVEVGPGPGGITRAILEKNCRRLDVIEIDKRFFPALYHLAEASEGRLHVHHGDALNFEIDSVWTTAEVPSASWYDDPPSHHIIGNLPFNIATPLVIRYLRDMSYRRGPWKFGRVPLTLTFQLEVAERICSVVDSVFRSRISVISQYVSEPKIVFTIPRSCFVPKPDVDVGVVKFIPRVEPLIKCCFELVEKVAREIFHYRQKYIIKGIMTFYPSSMAREMAHELLSRCRINPTTVSFKLGIEEYADICYAYEEQCLKIPGLYLYNYRQPKQLKELECLPNALPPLYKFDTAIPPSGLTLNDANILFNKT
ncbi:hypothetical protein AB6A40_008177 [Gnathostoma spinigerum]|uniref:rRNA adenine N(6)-methyltransferase n=1 Tax=Gnathostoma spinigerum TaxID=75299 RepID=A0ABD6ENM3_9BILA